MSYTLLSGGLIYNSSKGDFERGDILIKDDKIISISPQIRLKKYNVLSVNNCFITPGFIEINSEIFNHNSIFYNTSGSFFLKRGITSVIFGYDSISPFPFSSNFASFLVEILPPSLKVNTGWESLKDLVIFFDKKVGINFGFYIGYLTLRKIFKKQNGGDLSLGEIKILSRIIEKNLKEGAFGLSFDLTNPLLDVSYKEIDAVINFSSLGSKFVVNFSLKDLNAPYKSFEDLFCSLSNHSLNIEINQLQPFYYKEEEFLKILQKIDEFSSKQNIHFDVFPENFTKIKIQNLLPSWFLKQKVKSFLELRKDKFLLERVIQGVSFNFFDNAYLISLPKPLNFLNGRSLKELAQSHECSVAEEFIKIAILSKNKGEIIILNLNQEVLEVFVNHQKSILSLDYHFLYEDIGGDFYTKLFSSPRMIYKLTTLPAKKFGIYKRGEIKEGNYADLVVFKENKPFYVFINGKIVLKEGNFIGGGVGRHLKHNF